MSEPSPLNTTAAVKLWAVRFLRRLADELEHADRTTLADALLRLPLQELAPNAGQLFPGLADVTGMRPA